MEIEIASPYNPHPYPPPCRKYHAFFWSLPCLVCKAIENLWGHDPRGFTSFSNILFYLFCFIPNKLFLEASRAKPPFVFFFPLLNVVILDFRNFVNFFIRNFFLRKSFSICLKIESRWLIFTCVTHLKLIFAPLLKPFPIKENLKLFWVNGTCQKFCFLFFVFFNNA